MAHTKDLDSICDISQDTTSTPPRYIKFLDPGAIGPYSQHRFDTSKLPGEWLPSKEVVLCHSGYHFASVDNFIPWLSAEAYEIEARGTVVVATDKCAATSIRFVRRLALTPDICARFAGDCSAAARYAADARYAARYAAHAADAAAAAAAAADAARYAARYAAARYAARYAAAHGAMSRLLLAYMLDDPDAQSDALEHLHTVFCP